MVPSTTYRNNNDSKCNDVVKLCGAGYDWWAEQSTPVKIVTAIGGTLVFGAVVAGIVLLGISDCKNVTIINKSGYTMHFDDGQILYNNYRTTFKLPTDSSKESKGFEWGDFVPTDCDLVLQGSAPYAEVTKCSYPNAFVDFPGCTYEIKDKYQTSSSSSMVSLLSRVGTLFQSEPVPVVEHDISFTEEELNALQLGQEEVTRNLRGSFSS